MRHDVLVRLSLISLTLLVISIPVRADVIFPPVYPSPYSLFFVVANLIINFFLFSLAYLIFVESNIKRIIESRYLKTVVLITVAGFMADSVFYIPLMLDMVREPGILLLAATSLFIVLLDWLICRSYLKLTRKNSLILGLWMGLLTNPYLSYFIYPIFR